MVCKVYTLSTKVRYSMDVDEPIARMANVNALAVVVSLSTRRILKLWRCILTTNFIPGYLSRGCTGPADFIHISK